MISCSVTGPRMKREKPIQPHGDRILSRATLFNGVVLLALSLGGTSTALAYQPLSGDVRMGPSLTGATSELADRLDRAGLGIEGGVGVPSSRVGWLPEAQWRTAHSRSCWPTLPADDAVETLIAATASAPEGV